MLSLAELHTKAKGPFVGLSEYENIISTQSTSVDINSVSDYGSLYELKHYIKSTLSTVNDIEMLSAAQLGIPLNAVYVEYKAKDGTKQNMMLTDPQINFINPNKRPEFFIKLIKCPTSLTPYHIAMFTKDIKITSSNTKNLKITNKHFSFDPTLSVSAKLQQAIWANKGILPGDASPVLFNFAKLCDSIEVDNEYKDLFDCTVHREEIEYIINNLSIVWFEGYPITSPDIFIDNLILLMSASENEWIKLPPVDLFNVALTPEEIGCQLYLT